MSVNEKVMKKQKIKVEGEQSFSQFCKNNAPILMGGVASLAAPFVAASYGGLAVALSTLSLPFLVSKVLTNSKEMEEEMEKLNCFVPNEPSKSFYLNIGTVVREHSKKGPLEDLKNPSNILGAALLDETLVRTHTLIAGTTGSGKTQLAKDVMKQLLLNIGGGFMMIEGKGDNTMFNEIYAEVVMARREKDFYFLNFLDPSNSNSMNLLEQGDFASVRDLVVDFIIAGQEQDDWTEGGKELMAAFLKPLIYLRDSDLSFDVSKSELINSIEDMKKYSKKLSLFTLLDLLTTPKMMFEFSLALDRVYKKEGLKFANSLDTYTLDRGEVVKEYKEGESIPKIHESCINVLLQQVQELGVWDDVIKKGSYDEIEKSMTKPSESLYKLQISKSKFSGLFNTFLEDYGSIFGVEDGDINVENIITNGKILHCPLQGINPSQASSIAKILLSTIRMVAKKRAKEDPLVVPFVVFCDEFNSWSTGIKGFGDLLSVTRSYGLAFFIMGQSDLDKIDDGKGLEADQLFSNINTLIILKVGSYKFLQKVNELIPKSKYLQADFKEYATSNDDGTIINNNYQEKEEDVLTPEKAAQLQNGQAYIYTKGVLNKIVTPYTPDTTVYNPQTKLNLPKTINIDKRSFMEQVMEKLPIDNIPFYNKNKNDKAA